MQKIDRLGWADGIAFESYGLRCGVRVNDPAGVEMLRECLPPGWKPLADPTVDYLFSLRIGPAALRPNVRNFHILYGGPQRLARSLDLKEVLAALEGTLQLFVAEYAHDRIFVHAGVVGWHGQALLLPGRSFAGKSTLVAALVRAGAVYLSDEYAVLDRRGRVHPYLRRLSLRPPDGGPPERLGAEELGGQVGTSSLPVGLVAITRHSPGACWQPRQMSPGLAAMELLNNTVPARRVPEAALRALRKVVLHAPTLKGLRGEADETAGALLERLTSPCLAPAA